jgi:hypothetical protein
MSNRDERSFKTEGRGNRSFRNDERNERSVRSERRGERSFRAEGRDDRRRIEHSSTVGQGRVRVDRDEGRARDRDVRVDLNDRDRTRIRDVIVRRHIPRASNVDFDLRVGTVIPRRVQLISVPEEVVRIHPRFRRDRIFIANDEIVIVDPVTLRIIAVLPA